MGQNNQDKTINEVLREFGLLSNILLTNNQSATSVSGPVVSLYENQEILKSYYDPADVMVKITNREDIIEYANKKCCEALCGDEKDVLGKRWADFIEPVQIKSQVSAYHNKLMTGVVTHIIKFDISPVVTCSNEKKIIAWNNITLTDNSGNAGGLLSFGVDFTSAKNT